MPAASHTEIRLKIRLFFTGVLRNGRESGRVSGTSARNSTASTDGSVRRVQQQHQRPISVGAIGQAQGS